MAIKITANNFIGGLNHNCSPMSHNFYFATMQTWAKHEVNGIRSAPGFCESRDRTFPTSVLSAEKGWGKEIPRRQLHRVRLVRRRSRYSAAPVDDLLGGFLGAMMSVVIWWTHGSVGSITPQ